MDIDHNLSTPADTLPPAANSGSWRLVVRTLRDGMRHQGLLQTAWRTLNVLYRMMLELDPSKRKARYGDLDYDLEHSVNTTRSNVALKTQLTAALAGHLYFATEPYLFEEIMRALPADLRDFTFVDLGSGKGRVLLMASDCPFRRIVGVEFLRELHESAAENIARYSNERQQCRNIESVCMDVRDFEFPPGPLVIYMFNALPEPVFAHVLDNLRRSVQANPRPLFICYRYLEFEDLLKECGWLTKADGTAHWAVYGNRVIWFDPKSHAASVIHLDSLKKA